MASAMFSLAWPKERAPTSVGSAQVLAFVSALKARLPGAVAHVTRHISECTCTSTCGHRNRRRGLLADVAPSHYQGDGSCPGQVVFNVVVAHPNRALLVQLVAQAQRKPGAIWPQSKFGKLEAEGLSGIRLVPVQGYADPAGCAVPVPSPPTPPPSPSPPPPPSPAPPALPKPLVAEARANSHTSGTVTAATPAGLTCKQFVFTLKPQPPSKAPVATSPRVSAPTHTFHSLISSTKYVASVLCSTPEGKRVPGNITLFLTTPSARSFPIVAANPTASKAASVLLGPVSSGKPRSYSVRACLASAPTKCKSLQCTYVACGPLDGLTPGAQYVVTANATLSSGALVKASNNAALTMPVAAAPVLLLAKPAGFTTGQANALPPFTGPCNSYYWVFTPVAGGNPINATTTTLTIKTASNSLVPLGVYNTKVACIVSATSGRSLREVTLGPFSNILRFIMPAPNAPFLDLLNFAATTATLNVQPPAGAGWVRYQLTVCQLGGPAGSCRIVPCTTAPRCALDKLTEGTTHTVTATAFQADSTTKSDISNEVTFTTCPADKPTQCGSTCIAANTCCKTDAAAGAKCSAPFTCPADGTACACPARRVACGATCIDPATQCCKSNSKVGAQCAAPYTCPSDGGACGCLSGKMKCGSTCINPATQCCKSNSAIGTKCTAPFTVCSADGETCGCPSSSTKCGNVCINPANQCCKTTSAVGLQCSAPFTACSADGGTCGCPSGKVKCGNICIDTATQCCLSRPNAGKACAAGTACSADGGSCNTPPASCPAGQKKCGNVCINPASQCCKTDSALGLACSQPEACLADGGSCGCPAQGHVRCGSTCINPATKCCKTNNAVGKACTQPETCLADGGSCGCPTQGHVLCGSTCIDPATQCCKTDSTIGVPCTQPETCSADGGSCGCPTQGHVLCGSTCIDPATQCCKTDNTIGMACTQPETCPSDGGSCGCPTQADLVCGSTCIDPATQCCNTNSAIGVACTTPETCPSDGGSCGCPTQGHVLCGSTCIDPATQCCKTNSAVGKACTAPETCPADGGSCGCPTQGDVVCGSTCIDPATQCCKTDNSIGMACPQPETCPSDGGSCSCPTQGDVVCGSTCINPQSQCCKTDDTVGTRCLPTQQCSRDGGTCAGAPSCGIQQVVAFKVRQQNTCQQMNPLTKAPCFQPSTAATLAALTTPQPTASMVWDATDVSDSAYSDLAVKIDVEDLYGQTSLEPTNPNKAACQLMLWQMYTLDEWTWTKMGGTAGVYAKACRKNGGGQATDNRFDHFLQYKGTIRFVKKSDNTQAVTLPSVRITFRDMSFCDYCKLYGGAVLQERAYLPVDGLIGIHIPPPLAAKRINLGGKDYIEFHNTGKQGYAPAFFTYQNVDKVEYLSIAEGAGGLLSFDFSSPETAPCAEPTALTTCVADPTKPVPCGNSCIGYGQCCATNSQQGEQCPSGTQCLADGATCTCVGDATKVYCNGVCIPGNTCCASNPAVGATCTGATYAPEQTCPTTGGSCAANTNSVCGTAGLTSFKVDNYCTSSSPTDSYQGCWQPQFSSDTQLVPGTPNSMAGSLADYYMYGYFWARSVFPTTQRVGEPRIYFENADDSSTSPYGGATRIQTLVIPAAWHFYTDSAGRAVAGPEKVLKNGAVVELASESDAYTQFYLYVAPEDFKTAPTWMAAITGLRKGAGGALGTRMCVKNFSKWAADPAQIQASAATAGSWNEPCTMFEALVDNPDPVFITVNTPIKYFMAYVQREGVGSGMITMDFSQTSVRAGLTCENPK